jgi:hypothetical protein
MGLRLPARGSLSAAMKIANFAHKSTESPSIRTFVVIFMNMVLSNSNIFIVLTD